MIDKKIQEQIALRKLTILKGFKEVEEIQKGHMDFGDSRPDASSGGDGGKQGLVKKQITDKMGRKTSRWVRQGEDDKGSDNSSKTQEQEDKNEVGTKPGEEGKQEVEKYAKDSNLEKLSNHASKTESSVLKKFIDGDDEMAQAAREELKKRGELDDEGEEPMDYNNPDSVKFALDAHPDKDAIIDFAITHGVPIGQAMKLHDATKQDHSETHAAIDEAQNSLNSLKEKTGHPETKQRNEDDYEEDEMDTAEYGVMMYADEILNGTVDADSVGDFTMALGEVVQITPDIEKQANEVFRKIESTIGKDAFLEIIENETSDDELLANLEAMYDDAVANSEDEGEDDFINPGNTKEQSEDREKFNADKKDESGEDESGDFSGDDSDVEAMLDDLVEGIFNAQGKMDTTKLFDQYMALRDLGLSDSDIEQRVAPGAWEFPNMSDEEKQGMREDWDYAMEAILGEDRKKK
jgi:hypothetical protein